MKKSLVAIFLILFNISTFAMQSDNIKTIVQQRIEKALVILKDKKQSDIQKANKIFQMFDPMFDYTLMARLSIGKRVWNSLNDAKKEKYVKSFIKLLKSSFIEKLKLYNDQDIVLKDFLKIRKNRAILKSFIVGKKDKTEVDYKFYKNRKRGWIIYDVIVAGVSIIQSYRQQFADLLREEDFDTFLKKIANNA